jgi:hypothetical protein
VLAIGKASNANQVTVWWPGADQIETAVASLSEVVETLNAAGLSLSADEAPQIQHLPLRVSATDSLNAKPATVCVSGDPRLRSIVQDAMRSWRGMQFTCSDAGNDLVLTVAPTGRWIAVMPLEEGTAPIHFHGPQTAFEAIAVLRDRAGQELWWAKKEAWTGRGDQTHVAQQIARSFRKFYSTYVPPQRAASLTKPGSGSAP